MTATEIRTVRIDAGAGAVTVRAADVTEPIVDAGHAHQIDHTLIVHAASHRVSVVVPFGTDVVVLALAGRVTTTGRLGRVVVTAGAGRIDVEHADSIDVRATAARVTVGRCMGECRLKLATGRADIDHVGSLHLMSDAGRVSAREVDDEATVRATTGRVDIGVNGGGDVDIETLHGRIEVTVHGTALPHMAVRSGHGAVRLDVPDGDDFNLRVLTAHGRVEVGR